MTANIYDKAIQLLQVRMHTKGELFHKLKKRGYELSEIQNVILKLEEQKFLDDEIFAETLIDNYKKYKSFGYYGVKVKLAQKKIPAELAERVLQENFTLEDEEAVAKRYVSKLIRVGRKKGEQILRSLKGKGFRAETIIKTLNTTEDN